MRARLSESSPLRGLVAVGVGLAGAVAIWIAVPWNNYVVGNFFIADSYLPISAMAVMLLLVLGVNPLLRRLRPQWALGTRQLALIFGMLLIACCLPGMGLFRILPGAIAKVPVEVRSDRNLADQFAAMHLPAELFPDRIGYGVETPVSDYFLNELPPGEPVPWSAWAGPLAAWGALLACGWVMMLGLGMIVLPQWRDKERLAFPLLTIQRSMIADPQPGRLLAPLFRSRGFWIAAGAVFALRLLGGMAEYMPERVPAIPLKWDLSQLFSEEPWLYLPEWVRGGQIYFVFLGIAFFMPNRISLSIWFFILAYAAYELIGRAYAPPFYQGTATDHRTGALLALPLIVLWLGRSAWGRAFGSLFRAPRDEQDRRDRASMWMLLAGAAGMFAWLSWVGVDAGWAAFYVVFAFLVALLIARVIAETGMPFIRLVTGYEIGLVKLVPIAWLTPVSLYFSHVTALLFVTSSRVSVSVMATHSLALDEKLPPRRWGGRAALFAALLAVGLVVTGGAYLNGNYHHSTTLDGREQPVNSFGVNRLTAANKALLELRAGQLSLPSYDQRPHILLGAAIAAGLQVLCLTVPRWPLHPIGMLMIYTYYGTEAWWSVLLGWLAKNTIVHFGGAAAYRNARPFFIGIILGEVFAGVFWAAVPAVLVAMGQPYKPIYFLPV